MRYNVELPYGNTLDFTVTYYESDGETPINLSNYSASMAITNCEGTVVLALANGDGLTLGGADGTIQVFSQESLTVGTYDYDLTLTSGVTDSESVTTILQGYIAVTSLG